VEKATARGQMWFCVNYRNWQQFPNNLIVAEANLAREQMRSKEIGC